MTLDMAIISLIFQTTELFHFIQLKKYNPFLFYMLFVFSTLGKISFF